MNNRFADYLETLNGLLNVTQVSELMGLHKDTVYRWVRTMELPAMNIGATKTLLRFNPKDLAVWAREAPCLFRGPARAISDWMEEQVIRHGGPRLLLPPLPKVLQLIGYDWLEAARRRTSSSISVPRLMHDFTEAVNKLPIAEQRRLISDITSGKYDGQIFPVEEAE